MPPWTVEGSGLGESANAGTTIATTNAAVNATTMPAERVARDPGRPPAGAGRRRCDRPLVLMGVREGRPVDDPGARLPKDGLDGLDGRTALRDGAVVEGPPVQGGAEDLGRPLLLGDPRKR